MFRTVNLETNLFADLRDAFKISRLWMKAIWHILTLLVVKQHKSRSIANTESHPESVRELANAISRFHDLIYILLIFNAYWFVVGLYWEK